MTIVCLCVLVNCDLWWFFGEEMALWRMLSWKGVRKGYLIMGEVFFSFDYLCAN